MATLSHPYLDLAAMEALRNVRLQTRGGRAEAHEFDEQTQHLSLRLVGFCGSCPAWPMTLYGMIRPFFREALGLESVDIADRRISDAAIRRIRSAFERA